MNRVFESIIKQLEKLNITDIDVLQETAIEIIEQAAEKYKNKFVSIGVYQQVAWERDIAIEQLEELGYSFGEKIDKNDGWIPCSERLPKPFETVQVTYIGYYDKKPTSNGITAFIDETNSWCWTKGSHSVSVPITAWRENIPPYQPKGEQ